MEWVRINFIGRLMGLSVTLVLAIPCIAYSRASGLKVSAHNSFSSPFDSVINQLEGSTRQRSVIASSRANRSKSYEVNDCIKSLVDTLDVPVRERNQRNSVSSYRGRFDRAEHHNRLTQSVFLQEQPVKIVKKRESKENINTLIDLTHKRVDTVDQEFLEALNTFKNNRDFGQLALQHVIDLLDIELNLVRHLVAGHTGAMVQTALDDRNALLQRTIPVAVTLYDTILTLATYDNKHAATLRRRTMNGKKLPKALTSYDQKLFLSTIENKIEQYREVIRNMQYSVNQYAAVAQHHDIGHEQEKIMHDYLQELT